MPPPEKKFIGQSPDPPTPKWLYVETGPLRRWLRLNEVMWVAPGSHCINVLKSSSGDLRKAHSTGPVGAQSEKAQVERPHQNPTHQHRLQTCSLQSSGNIDVSWWRAPVLGYGSSSGWRKLFTCLNGLLFFDHIRHHFRGTSTGV